MEAVIKKQVTTALILDTRRQKKDESYPVKLRVTYRRKQKYYYVGKSLLLDDWLKIMCERPLGKYKKIWAELIEYQLKADKIVASTRVFTFYEFEKKFLQKTVEVDDVFSAFQEKMDQLRIDGKVGTAEVYSSSLRSIKLFYTKNKLYWEDINPQFLKEFESYLLHLEKPRSKNTISMYVRALRALYKGAIRKGIIPVELYPFGQNKDGLYHIPSKSGIKKALAAEDIAKIWKFKAVEGSQEHRARDMFIFSFLCNGINMHDISRLKYSNIEGDRLSFVRKKTETTTQEGEKTITAILTPEAHEIIRRWGNPRITDNTFVFPVLSPDIDPSMEKALVRQFTKITNKYLQRISRDCNIGTKISTYSARHSFATILKRSNAPISYISEALGHSNQKTTQTYLDSFDDDTKRSWSEQLSKSLQS